VAGFFGKLPSAGDFVARGLPQGQRPVIDRWLSSHLAEAARHPEAWPEGGLIAAIDGPGEPLLLLVVESRDAPGRAFPLAAADPLNGAGLPEAEKWAAAAFGPLIDAADGVTDAEALAARLGALPPPAPGAAPLTPPLVWAEGVAPGRPAAMLAALFAGEPS
jgi:type VI secretion system protein ImpM